MSARTTRKGLANPAGTSGFASEQIFQLTRVIEESIHERTVAEEGAHRCHTIEDAVPKGGIYEGDGLQLHVDEPGNTDEREIKGNAATSTS